MVIESVTNVWLDQYWYYIVSMLILLVVTKSMKR